jgi:hypothetical protein
MDALPSLLAFQSGWLFSRSMSTLASSTDPVECLYDPIIVVLVFANLLVLVDADLDTSFWRDVLPDSTDCLAAADFSIDYPAPDASRSIPTLSSFTVYKVTIKKPKQKKPNSYSWKFWKKAIQSFTTDGTKLNIKLGSWTKDHSRLGKWKS